MGGKNKPQKSKGLSKLLGKLWKSHGREMTGKAVDKYGQKGVSEAQRRLEQRGDKYGDRGAQLLATHGDHGIEIARSRLAQNQQYQAGYYVPAPQRPTARPPPSNLGQGYRR